MQVALQELFIIDSIIMQQVKTVCQSALFKVVFKER